MTPTLSELAAAVGLRVEGEGGLRVRGAAHPAEASADEIAVALSPRYEAMLGEGSARAALLRDGADWRALGLSAAILAPSPKHALVGLTARFAKPPHAPVGVHPTAFVDPSAEIGEYRAATCALTRCDGVHLGLALRMRRSPVRRASG